MTMHGVWPGGCLIEFVKRGKNIKPTISNTAACGGFGYFRRRSKIKIRRPSEEFGQFFFQGFDHHKFFDNWCVVVPGNHHANKRHDEAPVARSTPCYSSQCTLS